MQSFQLRHSKFLCHNIWWHTKSHNNSNAINFPPNLHKLFRIGIYSEAGLVPDLFTSSQACQPRYISSRIIFFRKWFHVARLKDVQTSHCHKHLDFGSRFVVFMTSLSGSRRNKILLVWVLRVSMEIQFSRCLLIFHLSQTFSAPMQA